MKKLSKTYKELGIDFTFPIKVRNAQGNETYFENSDAFWRKSEYDAQGNETYYEDSDGYQRKSKYDSKGNEPTSRLVTAIGASVNTMPRASKPTTRIVTESKAEHLAASRVMVRWLKSMVRSIS